MFTGALCGKQFSVSRISTSADEPRVKTTIMDWVHKGGPPVLDEELSWGKDDARWFWWTSLRSQGGGHVES